MCELSIVETCSIQNILKLYYCLPTKLRESNVFSHVRLFTGRGVHYPWCIGPHCKGTHPSLGPNPGPSLAPQQGPPPWPCTPLVTSDGQGQRPVETCSLKDSLCWWYLVAKTTDLFKLVHFRTPWAYIQWLFIEARIVGERVEHFLLEWFLVFSNIFKLKLSSTKISSWTQICC